MNATIFNLKSNQTMKNYIMPLRIFSISLIMLYSLFIKAQAPNPPDKICFNYDIAGNRIAQNPAWITVPIDCICNDPNTTLSRFDKINIIRITRLSDLNLATGFYTDIRWVLDIKDIPIGVLTDHGTISSPNFGEVSNAPNLPVGIILDLESPIQGRSIQYPTSPQKGVLPITSPLNLKIVPNPTEGVFQLITEGFDLDQSSIIIIDEKGSELFHREYINGWVNISEFSNGNYMLILKDSKNTKTARFIKK